LLLLQATKINAAMNTLKTIRVTVGLVMIKNLGNKSTISIGYFQKMQNLSQKCLVLRDQMPVYEVKTISCFCVGIFYLPYFKFAVDL
jgi:hypothetical protein